MNASVIVLVVTVLTSVGSGYRNPQINTVPVASSHSLPGFFSRAACESAKGAEVARIQALVGVHGRVVGECVEYPAGTPEPLERKWRRVPSVKPE